MPHFRLRVRRTSSRRISRRFPFILGITIESVFGVGPGVMVWLDSLALMSSLFREVSFTLDVKR